MPDLSPTAPAYATAGSACAGLVLWALDTYVFHGDAPGAVQGACWVLIPSLVGFVSSVLTRKYASKPASAAPVPAQPQPEKAT